MKNLALHWKIIISMLLGTIAGVALSALGWNSFAQDWIQPFGTIFINLLKLIAVPLVIASLISGVASLGDVSKLSRIGGRTVGLYLVTTVFAVVLGLVLVNIFQPGKTFSEEKREEFKVMFAKKAEAKQSDAGKVKEEKPLQPLIDIFPSNVFKSASDNGMMLQVIVFAIFFGMAMVSVGKERARPVKEFFEAVNDIVIKMVDFIMQTAPFGVFCLLAGLITEFAGDKPGEALSLLYALGYYSFVVVLGLAIMIVLVYGSILKFLAKENPMAFFAKITPAQMLAFSTSSSAATLPVTIDCLEKNVGIKEEIVSFVLPLGATVNMDGTSLYQAVAAIFIAQAFGMDLSLGAQAGIVLTATLASIGAAAVPGAGMVMLVIVLEQAQIPVEGLSLIFAVDRLLDMCRTVVNVTGDTVVCAVVAKMEEKREAAA
jgi:Na+/H+-dicarboxylate symporter